MKLSASGLYRVTDELGRIWKEAAIANLFIIIVIIIIVR
jgi:hypothetical protein